MHLKRHYIRGHAESQWQIATEFWLFRAPPFPSQFSLLHFSTTTQKVCLRSLQIYLCSHHFSSINFGMLLWFVIWIVISVLLGFFFFTSFLIYDFGNGALICFFRILSVMCFLIYACLCHFSTLEWSRFWFWWSTFLFSNLIWFHQFFSLVLILIRVERWSGLSLIQVVISHMLAAFTISQHYYYYYYYF